MSLTKTQENDKIEIVNKWSVQVRNATIIKDDGKEISRSFHRHVLTPGRLDENDNLIETSLSGEDSDVQAICNAVWTDQVKADYKTWLIDNKPTST